MRWLLLLIASAPCFGSAPAFWYNLSICNEPAFLYFEVPKTGTRTVHHLLGENFDLDIPTAYGMPYTDAYAGHYKFAFVRNPWDRIVSAYFNKVCAGYGNFCECWGKSFEEFVDYLDRVGVRAVDPHIRLQSLLFPVDEVDFIGRFENFEADLGEILRQLGVDEVNLPHLNPSKHSHYRDYYNEHTREIIGRLYQEDIERFGYEF